MDLAKLIKDAGADKPKQTRPDDAKWLNNAIQVKLPDEDHWAFYEGCFQYLTDGTEVISIMEQGFNDGRERIKTLKLLFPHLEFRLVAVMEVK